MSQKQKFQRVTQISPTANRKQVGARTKIIVGIIILVIVVGGGLGIFAIIRQHNTPSNVFNISVSGSITGSIKINTVNACGMSQDSAGYEIDASGSINSTSYELLLLIPTYQQPGTYSTTSSGATATVSLTEMSIGSQAWVSQGNAGSIVVDNTSHSGTISATLVSAATNAHAQITGTWSCA